MRITITHLRAAVAYLNRNTIGTDNVTTTTIGAYVLSGADGGWKLERVINSGVGVRSITPGYRPARELLDLIHAYTNGLHDGERIERNAHHIRADYCETCDTVHPAPSDCCPVTGDTYGLPA